MVKVSIAIAALAWATATSASPVADTEDAIKSYQLQSSIYNGPKEFNGLYADIVNKNGELLFVLKKKSDFYFGYDKKHESLTDYSPGTAPYALDFNSPAAHHDNKYHLTALTAGYGTKGFAPPQTGKQVVLHNKKYPGTQFAICNSTIEGSQVPTLRWRKESSGNPDITRCSDTAMIVVNAE